MNEYNDSKAGVSIYATTWRFLYTYLIFVVGSKDFRLNCKRMILLLQIQCWLFHVFTSHCMACRKIEAIRNDAQSI